MPAYPTYTHQRGSFSSSVIPDEDLAATISPEDVPDYLQHSIGMPPLEHVTDNMVEIPPETEWTTMYYNISKKDGTFSYRVIGNGNCDNNRGSNQDISYRCAKRFGQLVNEQINTFRSFHGTPSVHATCISRADTRGIFEHVRSVTFQLFHLHELHKTFQMNDLNSILDSRTKAKDKIPNSVVVLVTEDPDEDEGGDTCSGRGWSFFNHTNTKRTNLRRVLGTRIYIPPINDIIKGQPGSAQQIVGEQNIRGYDLAHEIYIDSECLNKDSRTIYTIAASLTDKDGQFSDCSVVWVNQSTLNEIDFLQMVDGIEDTVV